MQFIYIHPHNPNLQIHKCTQTKRREEKKRKINKYINI